MAESVAPIRPTSQTMGLASLEMASLCPHPSYTSASAFLSNQLSTPDHLPHTGRMPFSTPNIRGRPNLGLPNNTESSFIGTNYVQTLTPTTVIRSGHAKRGRRARPRTLKSQPEVDLLPGDQSQSRRRGVLAKDNATHRDGACWRCRKYKKPCDNNAVCASCLVSGFRVWPSELGCRRERLHTLTYCFLPDHFEANLSTIQYSDSKVPTWRDVEDFNTTTTDRRVTIHENSKSWLNMKRHVQDIMIFRSDFSELADIAEAYQSCRAEPNPCLDTCCALVVATCQLYRCFIRTTAEELIPPLHVIQPIVSNVRNLLLRALTLIERSCLTATRNDWFANTISVSLATCAAIIFIDTMISVPSPARERIWGDCHSKRSWMRSGSYGMLVDLLRASTRGVNPINLPCFERQHYDRQSTGVPGSPRPSTWDVANLEYKQTLLGTVDSASCSGVSRLKDWIQRNKDYMREATEMFRLDLYGVERIHPIGSLCKVYEW